VKLGVRAKLFFILIGLIAAAVALVDVYLTNALDRQLTDRIRDDLVIRASVVANQAATRLKASDRAAWDALADELGRLTESRVTLIARDGAVLGDSEVATHALPGLENHAARPEILGALANNRGSSIRYSTTLGQRMMYVAVPFARGEAAGVVRLAMPLTAVDEAVAKVRKSILLASFFAFLLAVVLASVAVQLTSKRLRRLTAAARDMAGGDLAVRTRMAMLSAQLPDTPEMRNRVVALQRYRQAGTAAHEGNEVTKFLHRQPLFEFIRHQRHLRNLV